MNFDFEISIADFTSDFFFLFRSNQFLDAMLHFMSLLPKLMQQQVDEDLRLREQSILVSFTQNN